MRHYTFPSIYDLLHLMPGEWRNDHMQMIGHDSPQMKRILDTVTIFENPSDLFRNGSVM